MNPRSQKRSPSKRQAIALLPPERKQNSRESGRKESSPDDCSDIIRQVLHSSHLDDVSQLGYHTSILQGGQVALKLSALPGCLASL